MIDRIPTKPGRVKIVPETGGSAYYAKIQMADDPVESGTPLNKESLLSAETAKMLNIPDKEATVNSAIALLAKYCPANKVYTEIAKSRTWVAPDNIVDNKVYFLVVGGGGSGAVGQFPGGGGGGHIEQRIATISPGNSYNIVIGSGGINGAGGTTSIRGAGVDISAGGGNCGTSSPPDKYEGNGGDGGSGGGGCYNGDGGNATFGGGGGGHGGYKTADGKIGGGHGGKYGGGGGSFSHWEGVVPAKGGIYGGDGGTGLIPPKDGTPLISVPPYNIPVSLFEGIDPKFPGLGGKPYSTDTYQVGGGGGLGGIGGVPKTFFGSKNYNEDSAFGGGGLGCNGGCGGIDHATGQGGGGGLFSDGGDGGRPVEDPGHNQYYGGGGGGGYKGHGGNGGGGVKEGAVGYGCGGGGGPDNNCTAGTSGVVAMIYFISPKESEKVGL